MSKLLLMGDELSRVGHRKGDDTCPFSGSPVAKLAFGLRMLVLGIVSVRVWRFAGLGRQELSRLEMGWN